MSLPPRAPIIGSYEQLIQTDPEYSWVSRHTWQSWRERYKKNASRLDVIIARVVEQKRPAQGQQGQYGYVRQPEEKPKRSRKKRSKGEPDGNDDEGATSNGVEDLAQLPIIPMPSAHPIQTRIGLAPSTATTQFQNIQAPQGYPSIIPTRPPIPIPASAPAPASEGQTEEEMEDPEETQWPVRVGTAPPPAWAKRKAEDELEDLDSYKRQKTRSVLGSYVQTR